MLKMAILMAILAVKGAFLISPILGWILLIMIIFVD